ncbi:glycosyltransferase family protein [Novosphingobium rosa]|uniref:UDP-N-acetylglucosamine--LPS N-acetylglucosamine transferase n=1 Tax=Novosphingobium rosa TaxID=76978 RepID=UPI0012EE4D91|nr:UDP-N-acetylglucosamine--LPS N-acetylglucosamine transferase [Novosphingobium rosa]
MQHAQSPQPSADRTQADQRRVALIASSGGHWIELTRLAPAVQHLDCLFITTTHGLTAPFGDRPVAEIMDGSRDTPWLLVRSISGIVKALRAFRPDVVITTGAAPGAVALLIGKMLGAVTIWVDSVANSEELSLSGKFARGFADLRLTQWEQLACPQQHISYLGRVL